METLGGVERAIEARQTAIDMLQPVAEANATQSQESLCRMASEEERT
ncbi:MULTISPECIES: hypothetical protein [unclassified Bradyrhizobium]|nr:MULTISPECIES: hypothetical protein [unclassified Bradyrhizobium]WGS18678.1 hypothetical protein MTX22_29590 [Bradyrhizobium sp. ISRA463]WGS25501.1 hypothetical protein MTX19_27170 [Bradyrhizobium sp. ISRA464]